MHYLVLTNNEQYICFNIYESLLMLVVHVRSGSLNLFKKKSYLCGYVLHNLNAKWY